MVDLRKTFTRQQIVDLTGVGDEVLAFWIAEGLINPSSGGGGKGNHRRFDAYQVSIAAVLAELRKFGVNIASLRSFAALLQRGALVCSGSKLYTLNLTTAASLAVSLSRFRNGEEITILEIVEAEAARDRVFRRPAKDEKEILSKGTALADYDDASDVEAFAVSLSADDLLPITLYANIAGLLGLDAQNGFDSNPWGESYWLLHLDSAGRWQVSDSDGYDVAGQAGVGFRSGIFLKLSDILNDVWTRS